MTDEVVGNVIIDIGMNVEDKNIREELLEVGRLVDKAVNRKAELIDARKLAVTNAQVQYINQQIAQTDNLIESITDNWSNLYKYLKETTEFKWVTLGEANKNAAKTYTQQYQKVLDAQNEIKKNQAIIAQGDKAMADAIIWMIDNPDKRQQMGMAALKASQRYKPENIMNKWIELFDEIRDL